MTPFNPDDYPPCPTCGAALTVTEHANESPVLWSASCPRWCVEWTDLPSPPTWRLFGAHNQQIRALLLALGVRL